MAKENPDSLIIGIDPCHKNLIDISAKILKKPEKGGLSNALFILANAENLPYELTNLVDKIYINFPWGSLLQGIVLFEEKIWNNIKKICKKNTTIEIIFGYNILYDKKEIDRLGLPILGESYLKYNMIPKIQNLGFKIMNIKKVSPKELNNYSTTWAKKLSFGQNRTYHHLKFSNR